MACIARCSLVLVTVFAGCGTTFDPGPMPDLRHHYEGILRAGTSSACLRFTFTATGADSVYHYTMVSDPEVLIGPVAGEVFSDTTDIWASGNLLQGERISAVIFGDSLRVMPSGDPYTVWADSTC